MVLYIVILLIHNIIYGYKYPIHIVFFDWKRLPINVNKILIKTPIFSMDNFDFS